MSDEFVRPELPQGIRDIDSGKINELVAAALEALEAIVDRGVVLTLFGIPIPIKIPKETP